MEEDHISRFVLDKTDFSRLRDFIDRELGIKMPPQKRVMLESRLRKRVKILDLPDFKSYCDYLFSSEGKSREIIPFFNCVTTNKTDFFRESDHFTYLSENVLPAFYKSGKKQLNIWSCACSSGEEPYTLAIVMEEFRNQNNDFKYQIYASDISTKVLDEAVNAVYGAAEVDTIPMNIKKEYFLKGKMEKNGLYRVKKKIRDKVSFFRLNLMDQEYVLPCKFDIIFCRNVLIYFERERQNTIIRKIERNLKEGGILFLGHSESMTGINLKFKSVAPAVFEKNKGVNQ